MEVCVCVGGGGGWKNLWLLVWINESWCCFWCMVDSFYASMKCLVDATHIYLFIYLFIYFSQETWLHILKIYLKKSLFKKNEEVLWSQLRVSIPNMTLFLVHKLTLFELWWNIMCSSSIINSPIVKGGVYYTQYILAHQYLGLAHHLGYWLGSCILVRFLDIGWALRYWGDPLILGGALDIELALGYWVGPLILGEPLDIGWALRYWVGPWILGGPLDIVWALGYCVGPWILCGPLDWGALRYWVGP